jgi:hypothetical protein
MTWEDMQIFNPPCDSLKVELHFIYRNKTFSCTIRDLRDKSGVRMGELMRLIARYDTVLNTAAHTRIQEKRLGDYPKSF